MASVAKRTWTHKGAEATAWVVRYKDRGGAHRSKQFTLKKEADAYRRRVEAELEAGSHVARSQSMTVNALADEFLADMGGRAREGQITLRYHNRCRQSLLHARPHIGGILLVDLRWQDVEDLVKKLRLTNSKMYSRPLAKRTIKAVTDTLRTMVGFGVRRGYAARNVVVDALSELGTSTLPRIETFTREEMRHLLTVIEQRQFFAISGSLTGTSHRTQAMMRAMVYLAAVCGLRKGEIMALTWERIDACAGLVKVRNSLTEDDVLKGPKTVSGIRDVPLPPVVLAALEAYRPYVVEDERGLIFRTKRGTLVESSDFYKHFWHPLLRKAGMQPGADQGWRHFHALRHFAGSAWLEAGVPLPEVSRLLGHAHAGITAQVYSHAIVGALHRADMLAGCATAIMPGLAQLPPPTDAQELRKAA